jgi:hypothetical protein
MRRVPERRAPPVLDRERRQRPNDAIGPHGAAIVGFDAPEGNQHVAVDVVSGLDGSEGLAERGELLTACFDARFSNKRVEIVARRLEVLRLRRSESDDLRIRREPGRGPIEHGR